MREATRANREFRPANQVAFRRGAYAFFIVAALIPIVAIPLISARIQPFPVELALASVVAGGFFFVLGYTLFRQATSVYLVTSPEGIEYHTGGKMADALWSEITSIRMLPLHSRYPVEGLVVKSKVAPAAPVVVQREQGWYIWYIPLQPFGWYWKETGLGEEIRRYAPHLLNTQQEQPSKSDTQEHQ